jgi:multidrug efflux pump subunit AcrB
MSKYSVKKPITVLMGILIVIVLGLFSVTRLPLTLFPDINLPFVVTVTPYPGASPEEVESEISRKIEANVATIGNFESIQSISNENFGVSIITFAQSSNMDSVIIEIRELLNNVTFADGVDNTRILRLSPDLLPVMSVTFFRDYDELLTDDEALIRNTEWVNRDIINDLLSIPGVADVEISGAADIILEVNLDQDLLTQYNLNEQTVLEIIEAQNAGGLIGVALDEGELRLLYLGTKPATLDEIKALPITFSGGEVITLEALAIVDGISYINGNDDVYSKVNGVQGIQISFQKQSDVGITEVTDSIIARLDQIIENDPLESSYSVLFNQGEFITQSVNTVLQNLIVGGLLAIIVLFLFLKDIKPTIVVGLAIPISVIAAFMLMYFTNVSLNLISMGGLALGIGMLVDNSVVVIENIYRMISEGKSKVEAAVDGARQVAGAITASTLTTVAVFIPILFVEGLVAEVFVSMALTIAYSLGASLVIALTLVPSLSSRLLNDQDNKKEGKLITKSKAIYKSSVLYTIKHKFLTLGVVFVLLGASLALVISRGFILLPTSDEGTINISIDFASQTAFEDKAEYADELTALFLDFDEIENVSARIGGGGRGPFGGNMMGGGASGSLNFTINLKNSRTQSTVAYQKVFEDVINDFDLEGVTLEPNQLIDIEVSAQNSTGNFGGASGINIKVSGFDLLTLEAIANDITLIVANTEGVKSADNGITQGADNVLITVNRDQAMRLGMTSKDVSDNISYLFQNLGNLGQTQQFTVSIEGIEYVLEIPVETIAGGLNFDLFGDYLTFLSGVQLFDAPTRAMIDAYVLENNQGIYVPNFLLPTYNPGDPIQLIVNPFLKVTGDNRIELNPVSADPTLSSLSIAPLYQEDASLSVTSIERVTGFASINTDGSSRYLTVTGQVEDGKNITLVSQAVNANVNAYLESEAFSQYGGGYVVSFEGENEEIIDAVIELALAAFVAILLVYMIMAIQFQSLVYPFIILGTIPLAFTGGLMALLVTNSFLSLVSIMGLIILIGIVVNNGIVLIDYINKLREQGKPIMEAIVEAGQTRLRPIFMTALTTILALTTLAIGIGEGAELLQPMAITAIGGLIYATILTLVVIPTIYALLNRKLIKKEEAMHANDER